MTEYQVAWLMKSENREPRIRELLQKEEQYQELVAALKRIACIAVSKAYDIQARDQTAACAFEALKKAGAL